MANQERIEEFVSEAGFAQLEKLIKVLDGANDHIVTCILAAEKLNATLAKSGAFKDYEATVKKLEIANENLRKSIANATLAEEKLAASRKKEAVDFEARVQKQIAIQEKKSAKSVKLTESERLAEIKLEQDRKKSFDKYEAGVQKQNAVDEKRAQVIANNSRPYTVLSNELEKQRKRAQDLAIVYGEQSKQFLEAAKSVITLDTRLKAVDATLGKSQRNVGNYKSGFNGLANSVNQMTRELPAFTFSVQTGFMALSNNIPIFIDQIQQTRAEIARLRAEGQKVPGLFKQLASSIFSFGTVMSVVITLMTVYGKEIGEFFGAMFKGTEAVDKFTESQKRLGEAMASSEVTKVVKSVAELKINIDLAKQGLLDKEKVVKQYNESIGKTTGEVKNLDEAEKELNANAANYIKVTLLKAAAQLALEEAAKTAFEAEKARERGRMGITRDGEGAQQNLTFGERLEAAFAQNDTTTKNLVEKGTERTVKAADDRTKTFEEIAAKFQGDAAKLAKASGFNFFDDDKDKSKKSAVNTSEFDAQQERVDRTKNAAKEILDDEKNSFDMRLQALDVFNNQADELVNIDFNRSVKKAKGNADQIKFLEEKRLTDLQDIEINGRKLSFKLLTDQLNEEQKERLRINQQELSVINETEAIKLDTLNSAFANRTISEKQYGELRQNIQREYIQKYIEAEIKQVQDLLEVASLSTDQRADYEKKLSDLKLKLSREVTKNQIEDNKTITKSEEDNAKKRAEIDKQLADKKKELQKEVFDLGVAIINGSFEREQNKVQDEIDLREKRKQSDIEDVNNSLLTEQEKADKIRIIEAQSLANKEVLEQKQRDIEKRKAQFQKVMAVAEVGINTAKDVAKVSTGAAVLSLTPIVGPILAAAALAQIPWMVGIGATQIAAILAMPAFKDGGVMAKSGLALFGEVGSELRIDPSGQLSLTPDKPTVGYVEAGTQFISNADLVRMTARPELNPISNSQNVDLTPLLIAQENSTKKLIKAYSSQNGHSTIITKRGWRSTQSRMDNISKYLKKNFN